MLFICHFFNSNVKSSLTHVRIGWLCDVFTPPLSPSLLQRPRTLRDGPPLLAFDRRCPCNVCGRHRHGIRHGCDRSTQYVRESLKPVTLQQTKHAVWYIERHGRRYSGRIGLATRRFPAKVACRRRRQSGQWTVLTNTTQNATYFSTQQHVHLLDISRVKTTVSLHPITRWLVTNVSIVHMNVRASWLRCQPTRPCVKRVVCELRTS